MPKGLHITQDNCVLPLYTDTILLLLGPLSFICANAACAGLALTLQVAANLEA